MRKGAVGDGSLELEQEFRPALLSQYGVAQKLSKSDF